MKPTHSHADGGLYELVEPASMKDSTTGEWLKGFAYRGKDERLRFTTTERWEERFEEAHFDHVATVPVEVQEDEEVVASFVFHVEQAGDIRYMLIKAGPMGAHRLTRNQQDWIGRVLQSQAEAVTQGLHIRDHDFPDLIGDVNAFHAKFGQEYLGKPRQLPADLHDFRVKFHAEETHEYRDEYPKLAEAIERQDRRDIINALELQLDALCDAAWVVLGTADLQFGRSAFNEAWRRVVKANMAKVRKDATAEGDGSIDSGREAKYDIVKPAGWQAPDHRDLVSDNEIFDVLFTPPEAELDFMGTSQDVDPTRYSDTRAV